MCRLWRIVLSTKAFPEIVDGYVVLRSWWQHAANLATYEQQDAHEFFISMLDGIHEKVEKDRSKLQSQGRIFLNSEICLI